MTMNLTNFEKTAQRVAVLLPASKPDPEAIKFRPYRNGLKRVLDVVLVLIAAPLVVPLVAVLAALIALDGGKPFYSQLRLGRNGEIFRIWKLRSMVTDADARLASHLASDPVVKREWDTMQKLRDDPRITKIGRIIRKGSLDELPQLLNVLTGTMSLVGPRPMLIEQRPMYNGTAYFHLRPGITGPWQVSDRNNCAFAGRVQYDETYNRDLSLMTDLRLLAQTIVVVMRGTGC
jgi:lipopolysaccharide/colanic/teichoic acid biosynthesis glycosyltransferase